MNSGLLNRAAFVLAVLLLSFEIARADEEQPYRTWTRRDGKTLVARLVRATNEEVVLESKSSGKTHKISLKKLSIDDRRYVKPFIEASLWERIVGPEPNYWKLAGIAVAIVVGLVFLLKFGRFLLYLHRVEALIKRVLSDKALLGFAVDLQGMRKVLLARIGGAEGDGWIRGIVDDPKGLKFAYSISRKDAQYAHHFYAFLGRNTPHGVGDRYIFTAARAIGLPVERMHVESSEFGHYAEVRLDEEQQREFAETDPEPFTKDRLDAVSAEFNRERPGCHGFSHVRLGRSPAAAVVATCIDEEYAWLQRHYPNAQPGRQALWKINGLPHDVFTMKTATGPEDVFFDVSLFYGKSP